MVVVVVVVVVVDVVVGTVLQEKKKQIYSTKGNKKMITKIINYLVTGASKNSSS